MKIKTNKRFSNCVYLEVYMKLNIQILNNNLHTLNTEFLNYQHTQKGKQKCFSLHCTGSNFI